MTSNPEKGELLPAYEEPGSESTGLPSDAAAQAAAAIEGDAADTPSTSGGVAPGAPTHPRLSTIDSYYRDHLALDGSLLSEEELNAPPPAYSDEWGHIQDEHGGMGTNAQVADDGRVNIRIDQRSRKLSSLLVPALRQQLEHVRDEGPPPPPYVPESLGGAPGTKLPPPLNIVIHVVGSRGDVQPFVALGKVLKDSYKHRVRLATHPTFKTFVEENGLEFFSIGGDPSELMAFMVKNPGLMPGFDAIRSGDVGKRRAGIAEIIKGCWRSCFEIGDGMSEEITDTRLRETAGQEIQTAYLHAGAGKPFIADAIIANPPSFAHVHCAERLGIPLHMMFTMPWSPTQSFPHPLANIQSSDADTTMTNFISYALVDLLTWQGLGDIINRFRVHSLQLEPISLMWAPGMLARLRVPWTYCWSPALIPKPKDWPSHISISGFYFLNLASNYTPAPELAEFLQAGPPPVYIGFGSIVVDDPNALTKMIFEAVQKSGVRALVSKGWGGIGADELGIPEGVFMLGNVPHDWLFQHVSCVVHHGGAGTTAAGIAAGKPTFIVPFFGDQPFWGAMVARAGAGPKPIPHKLLTADNFAESITFCLKPESQVKAKEMAMRISQEKGNESGAESFHQMLPGGVDALRCSVMPDRAAVWRVKRTNIRLSALAACVLAEEKILSFGDLKLYRPTEYETDEAPWDPISGGAGALIGTAGSMMMGVADLPFETLKAFRIHPERHSKATSPKPETPSKAAGPSNHLASASTSSISLPEVVPSRTSSELASSRNTTVSSASGSTPSLVENGTIIGSDIVASPVTQTTTSTRSIPRKPVSPGAGSSNRQFSEPSTALTDLTPMASPTAIDQDTNKLVVPEPSSHRSMSTVFSHSRSRSGSRSSRPCSRGQSPSGSSHDGRSRASSVKTILGNEYEASKHAKLDTVLGTGKGLQRIVGAGLKSPMDFSLGLAKGFHNAPKLYGDDTVREVDKVTGVQSGLKTATKELGYGLYDGITGLVTQPYRGAKKSGAKGFMKGFGMGLAGVVMKPGAGLYGIPGYTLKGVYQEIQKHFGASVNNYIIASRTAQGYADFTDTTKEERKDVVNKYLECQYEALRKRSTVDEHIDVIREKWVQNKERKQSMRDARKESKSKGKGKARAKEVEAGEGKDWGKELVQMMTSELAQRHRAHRAQIGELDGRSLRHAASAPVSSARPVSELEDPTNPVLAELPGDHPDHKSPVTRTFTDPRPEKGRRGSFTTDSQASVENLVVYEDTESDDEELEEAIKLSVQQTSTGNEEEDALITRAIRASIAALENDERHQKDADSEMQNAIAASVAEAAKARPEGVDEEEYDRALKESLEKSLREQRGLHDSEMNGTNDDNDATDSDEDLKRALDESIRTPAPTRTADDAEEELKKALEESKAMPVPVREVDSDEDEELKKAVEESKAQPAPARDLGPDEDEELKRIMEESKAMSIPAKEMELEEDEELQRIMEESKSAAKMEEEEEQKRRREEEIVMEYVKKQSLVEEELRRKRLQGRPEEEGWEVVGEASGTK